LASSGAASVIFYAIVVLFGTFFLRNLVIAVMSDSFASVSRRKAMELQLLTLLRKQQHDELAHRIMSDRERVKAEHRSERNAVSLRRHWSEVYSSSSEGGLNSSLVSNGSESSASDSVHDSVEQHKSEDDAPRLEASLRVEPGNDRHCADQELSPVSSQTVSPRPELEVPTDAAQSPEQPAKKRVPSGILHHKYHISSSRQISKLDTPPTPTPHVDGEDRTSPLLRVSSRASVTFAEEHQEKVVKVCDLENQEVLFESHPALGNVTTRAFGRYQHIEGR
jgi:hypothetical protein